MFSQTGPGGVDVITVGGNLKMWWRADIGVTLTGGKVSTWADQTANGNNLVQVTAASRPITAVSAALNNQTIMRYSGSQYFTSAFSGPNVNNITLFLVANGTSYQSLFRFQNNAGIYVVYPWEFGGAARTFISSSDGGTGSGIASGLVSSVNNVGVARYKINTAATGMQTFLNGGVNTQRTSVNSILPTQPFFSGTYNPGSSEFPNCDVGEMIAYYSALNDAQVIIVQNYLAAKYNVTLTSNDIYTMDNPANGDYDHDVAGIGQAADGTQQTDSRGTGILEVKNAAGYANAKYFIWGDNNGVLGSSNNTVDVPAPVQARLNRVWRANNTTNSFTSEDMYFDLAGLGAITPSDLRLLIDKNNNGIFSDETVGGGGISPLVFSLSAGTVYKVLGVNIQDAQRFTIGTINSLETPLPIELLSFTATPCNSNVCLDWSTATETNNNYFTVERSKDGVDFEIVSIVNGAGNSTSVLNYSSVDNTPYDGVSYYRLKQTDFNGAFKYSVVKTVDFNAASDFTFNVYPNPNNGDNINIAITADKGQEVLVVVYDISGKESYSKVILTEGSGENIYAVDPTNKLAPGIYMITASSNQSIYHKKMVVK